MTRHPSDLRHGVALLEQLAVQARHSRTAEGPAEWLDTACAQLQALIAELPSDAENQLLWAESLVRVRSLRAYVDSAGLNMAAEDWLAWASTRVAQLLEPDPAQESTWFRVVPALWWPQAQAYVVADSHMPDGTRRHLVRGTCVPGHIVAGAQVLGEEDQAPPVTCTELSHLCHPTVLAFGQA